MRKELLYDPLLLLERIGQWATKKRRLRTLRGTIAARLTSGHIDSLELLELAKQSNPKVIYDIGANVGTWTLLAKTVMPGCVVHAFEPLKDHSIAFREATKDLEGVTLHEIALGDVAGKAEIHVTSFSDASSMLHLTDRATETWHLKESNTLDVSIDTIDNLIANSQMPPPDVLKLDVQGYELVVLRGAKRGMEHAESIIIEVSFQTFYKDQCLFQDVVSFLAEHGFSLVSIGHGVHLSERLVQADLLFQKNAN